MQVHFLDIRAKDVVWVKQVHTVQTKVSALDVHPMQSNLLLTGGNDHICKLFDIRALGDATDARTSRCVLSSHLSTSPHTAPQSSLDLRHKAHCAHHASSWHVLQR